MITQYNSTVSCFCPRWSETHKAIGTVVFSAVSEKEQRLTESSGTAIRAHSQCVRPRDNQPPSEPLSSTHCMGFGHIIPPPVKKVNFNPNDCLPCPHAALVLVALSTQIKSHMKEPLINNNAPIQHNTAPLLI